MDTAYDYIQQNSRGLWCYTTVEGGLSYGLSTREEAEREFECYKQDHIDCPESLAYDDYDDDEPDLPF